MLDISGLKVFEGFFSVFEDHFSIINAFIYIVQTFSVEDTFEDTNSNLFIFGDVFTRQDSWCSGNLGVFFDKLIKESILNIFNNMVALFNEVPNLT